MEEKTPSENNKSDLLERLEALSNSEEKLRASILFMREALSQEKAPNFKGFWEVRKLCLNLFKEPLSSPLRSQLWGEYIELTREGRRLKNLLDGETAFAVEQINLAILALEDEVKQYNDHHNAILENSPPVEFSRKSKALEGRYAYYETLQKELGLLNRLSSRINALRKELAKTEMRIRQKNKFFQRLSSLGDSVFPPRKTMIREVSDSFIKDVQAFTDDHFSSENFYSEQMRHSVFHFREEIKTLQAVAKLLTLNTHAFSTTRDQLSKCWDQLKLVEKERKKQHVKQKQQSSEYVQKVHERIDSFKEDYQQGFLSLKEGMEELDAIDRWMRELELTRDDVRSLKEALKAARQPVEAKEGEEQEIRRQNTITVEKKRQENIEKLKGQIEALKEKISVESVEILFKEQEECRGALSALAVTKSERQFFDRALKSIRDQIIEKQEQGLIDLSEDDRVSLDNLSNILTERKKRRREIKTQIEEYRKIIGGSGLDFEKAMRYNELMAAEKDRLVKIDEGIVEIEKKISKLKSK